MVLSPNMPPGKNIFPRVELALKRSHGIVATRTTTPAYPIFFSILGAKLTASVGTRIRFLLMDYDFNHNCFWKNG